MQEFLTDVKVLRDRARESIEKSASDDTHEGKIDRVILVLNHSLAMELVSMLRYKRHYVTAQSLNAQSVADEFLQNAGEESDHADMIAGRIRQLGGHPEFNPDILSKPSHSDYDSFDALKEMIREDLVAERVAISMYSEIIQWLGEADLITRQLLEEILATEREHADDMRDLLAAVNYWYPFVGERGNVRVLHESETRSNLEYADEVG